MRTRAKIALAMSRRGGLLVLILLFFVSLVVFSHIFMYS